jgi:hypothetical protein
MSKTASGILLLSGLAVAALAAPAAELIFGTGKDLDPSQDWLYSLASFGTAATILLGVVMFFLGAKWFARK